MISFALDIQKFDETMNDEAPALDEEESEQTTDTKMEEID